MSSNKLNYYNIPLFQWFRAIIKWHEKIRQSEAPEEATEVEMEAEEEEDEEVIGYYITL